MTSLSSSAVEAALALLAGLAPLIVLLALVASCANANRLRLTALAERIRPLRLLLWLGVAVHEGGHALSCVLTFTRIRQIQVRWHSGFVKHDARGALVSALIAAGPILSATLLAVFASAWMFGARFAVAAAPFRTPLSTDISIWSQSAAFSLAAELARLVASRGHVHLPLLLVLAGLLSSAAPSPPDLRNAVPGLLWMAAIALMAETGGRALTGVSLVELAQPLLHEVSGALGIAGFACLLGALVIFPLTLLLPRKKHR